MNAGLKYATIQCPDCFSCKLHREWIRIQLFLLVHDKNYNWHKELYSVKRKRYPYLQEVTMSVGEPHVVTRANKTICRCRKSGLKPTPLFIETNTNEKLWWHQKLLKKSKQDLNRVQNKTLCWFLLEIDVFKATFLHTVFQLISRGPWS